MRTITKLLAAGAGIAAIAAAAPAAAQYPGYYGYSQPYGYAYGNPYGYANTYAVNPQLTNIAVQQCNAAVQNRLYYQSRANTGVVGVIGSVLGVNTAPQGRVLSVTQVTPRANGTIRVRGLASSGRMAGYGPYGMGAYGALGYANQADLSFRCDVDYRGYVRNVDLRRR